MAEQHNDMFNLEHEPAGLLQAFQNQRYLVGEVKSFDIFGLADDKIRNVLKYEKERPRGKPDVPSLGFL